MSKENEKNENLKYQFIDTIKSDVMFEAYGKTLKELFENSALALSSIICHRDKVKAKIKKAISIEADNTGNLLVSWLQSIISVVDTDEIFLVKFNITAIDEKSLKAECFGDEISPEKGNTLVKAVTYYDFKLTKSNKGYFARISFDI